MRKFINLVLAQNQHLYFYETTYVSCPTRFSDARFRFATEEEKEELKPKLLDGYDDLFICITIDEDCDPT